MTFSDQRRYNRLFQKLINKAWESEINYIKIFHDDNDLSISVGNSYPGDQSIHTFPENFQKGVKYSAQIASHEAKLRREVF